MNSGRKRKRKWRISVLFVVLLVVLSAIFFAVYRYSSNVYFPPAPDIWIFEGSGNSDGSLLAIVLNQSGAAIAGLSFEFNFYGIYDRVVTTLTSSDGMAHVSLNRTFQPLQEYYDMNVYEGGKAVFSVSTVPLSPQGGLSSSYVTSVGTWGRVIGGSNQTAPVGALGKGALHLAAVITDATLGPVAASVYVVSVNETPLPGNGSLVGHFVGYYAVLNLRQEYARGTVLEIALRASTTNAVYYTKIKETI
ncbi:MAG: hypothetical protein QXP70_06585 [Methanomassiliicoccales archaeon]